MIKMRFQYGRNPYSRSYSGKETSQNGAGEDQGSKRVENANESQRHGKFSQICKLQLTLYPEFQPHSKTIKQIKRKKEIEMGQITPKSIQGA